MKVYEITFPCEEEFGHVERCYVPTKARLRQELKELADCGIRKDVKVNVLEIPTTAKGFCAWMEGQLIIGSGL